MSLNRLVDKVGPPAAAAISHEAAHLMGINLATTGKRTVFPGSTSHIAMTQAHAPTKVNSHIKEPVVPPPATAVSAPEAIVHPTSSSSTSSSSVSLSAMLSSDSSSSTVAPNSTSGSSDPTPGPLPAEPAPLTFEQVLDMGNAKLEELKEEVEEEEAKLEEQETNKAELQDNQQSYERSLYGDVPEDERPTVKNIKEASSNSQIITYGIAPAVAGGCLAGVAAPVAFTAGSAWLAGASTVTVIGVAAPPLGAALLGVFGGIAGCGILIYGIYKIYQGCRKRYYVRKLETTTENLAQVELEIQNIQGLINEKNGEIGKLADIIEKIEAVRKASEKQLTELANENSLLKKNQDESKLKAIQTELDLKAEIAELKRQLEEKVRPSPSLSSSASSSTGPKFTGPKLPYMTELFQKIAELAPSSSTSSSTSSAIPIEPPNLKDDDEDEFASSPDEENGWGCL